MPGGGCTGPFVRWTLPEWWKIENDWNGVCDGMSAEPRMLVMRFVNVT